MNLIVKIKKCETLYQLINFLFDKYTYSSKINITDKKMTLELIMRVVYACVMSL